MPVTDAEQEEKERVAVELAATEARTREAAQAEDAQFDAGFEGKTTPDEDRVPTDLPAEGVPGEPPPGETAKEDTPLAQPAPSLTKEQVEQILSIVTLVPELKTTMEKQFGSAFGKIGGLSQTLKGFQESSAASGEPIKISKDDFQDMVKEFPDLTDKLVPVFNRVFERVKIPKGGSVQTFDPSEISKVIDQRIEELTPTLRKQQAAADLTEMHADWRDVVGAPGGSTEGQETPWKQWLSKQPVDYQTKIKNAWNATIIANSIDRFHADSEKANAVKPGSDPAAGRKQRLLEAVNQRSSASQVTMKTEDELFDEGFRGSSK